MVCHSLLQWTTFCQTSPPWSDCLGWPHTAWLSFIELDKTVVRVIRWGIILWLWFSCVCPLMPSRSTYCLTWVSHTLDVGYLIMAAPAKRSSCSLPWTMGISSWPPLESHGLCNPWNSPHQNTGVGGLSLLQGVFPTQGWNLSLLHCRRTLYHLNHQGSPTFSNIITYMKKPPPKALMSIRRFHSRDPKKAVLNII